jgi:hypothetical protein
MKEYSIYLFDSGHVNATYMITAANDDDAIQQAKEAYLESFHLDIWEGRRFVARLKPGD